MRDTLGSKIDELRQRVQALMTHRTAPPDNPNASTEVVNLETLALALAEARNAHHELMDEIKEFNQAAERDIQINLLIIGIMAALIGSEVIAEMWLGSQLMAFAVLVLLIGSALWMRLNLMWGEFYRGSIDPNVLRGNLSYETANVQIEMLDAIVQSYEHNQPEFIIRTRRINWGRWAQISAILLLVTLMLIEGYHLALSNG